MFDCRRCGACCHSGPGTILVTAADLVRWKVAGRPELAAATIEGHFSERAVPYSTDKGACAWLGTSESALDCSIYSERPNTCRDFAEGSAQCLDYRRQAGLPVHLSLA